MTAVLDGPSPRPLPAPARPRPAPLDPELSDPALSDPALSDPAPLDLALSGPAPRLRPARCRRTSRTSTSARDAPAVPRLADHPDARAAVVRVLRLACEVLDGRRPAAHLAPHAEPIVLRYWRAAGPARRPSSPTRLARPHVQHPGEGVAEVAATLDLGGRPRALAARFDLVDGRWRWTAVRLG